MDKLAHDVAIRVLEKLAFLPANRSGDANLADAYTTMPTLFAGGMTGEYVANKNNIRDYTLEERILKGLPLSVTLGLAGKLGTLTASHLLFPGQDFGPGDVLASNLAGATGMGLAHYYGRKYMATGPKPGEKESK